MWNFDECKEKLAMQYKEPNWIEESGISCSELEDNVKKICEQSEKISVAKAKCDGICYIFRNARLGINPDEIFADQLDCEGALYRSYIYRKNEFYC